MGLWNRPVPTIMLRSRVVWSKARTTQSILPGHMGTRIKLVKFAVKLWVSSPEQQERKNYIKKIAVKEETQEIWHSNWN